MAEYHLRKLTLLYASTFPAREKIGNVLFFEKKKQSEGRIRVTIFLLVKEWPGDVGEWLHGAAEWSVLYPLIVVSRFIHHFNLS